MKKKTDPTPAGRKLVTPKRATMRGVSRPASMRSSTDVVCRGNATGASSTAAPTRAIGALRASPPGVAAAAASASSAIMVPWLWPT